MTALSSNVSRTVLDLNEARRLFHEAVAAEGKPCGLIKPGNRITDFRNWTAEFASEESRAYCVEIKPHLMAFDFDPENGIELARQMAERLEALGEETAIFASGGPGRAHLWVAPHYMGFDQIEALGREFTADNRSNTRIRPPLSPHRNRAGMTLLHPADMAEALARLAPTGRARPKPTKTDRHNQPEPTGPYRKLKDPNAEAKRQTMLHDVGRPDRSTHIFRVAGFYRSNGLSEAEFIRDVKAHPEGVGHKYFHPQPRRDMDRRLAQDYRNAQSSRSNADRSETLRGIELAQQAAQNYAWPSRCNALATFATILSKARALGSTEIVLSARDVAEYAGTTYPTASRHLQILVSHGFLSIIEKAGGSYAAKYKILCPEMKHSLTPPYAPLGCERVFQLGTLSHDAFQRRGSWRHLCLYLQGSEAPLTVCELANRSHRSQKAVRNALNRLEAHGLAERHDDGTWSATITDETLAAAADMRQTTGRAKLRRAEHQRHRDGWHQHLAVTLRARHRQEEAPLAYRHRAPAMIYAYA
jgi:DNA-binding IclR family transcriptional regulator